LLEETDMREIRLQPSTVAWGAAPVRVIVLLMLALAIATGCRSYGVRSDWDPMTSFDAMRSYHFEDPPEVEGANPFADNSLLRKRVRRAIELVLEERGFAVAESRESADFVVTYQVLLEDELRVNTVSSGSDFGFWRYRGMQTGAYSSAAQVRSVQEATLLVDMLSPESSELAWRGWGQGMLTTRDRDRTEERLLDGVRAILASFPPNDDA